MAKELPPVRRVITAINAAGKSCFTEDGPAHIKSNPNRPGMRSSHIWATSAIPCPIQEPDQAVGGVKGIMPPKNGSVLHIIDYPPDPKDPAERERIREHVRKMGTNPEPGVRRFPDGPHPGMHVTDTIDYAIVLSGEIWAIMDEGEKLLKTGDVLMQRGTSHAWSNRSDEYCRVAFVLVEAKP
jgi:quercetin dioxygenase-like cupin family protein